MQREMIERIKAEVRAEMRSEFGPSVESFIDAYADRLIERIDAERGKSAAAVVEGVDGYTGLIKPLRKLNAGTTLFTSPTIQEGMALVPVEPTEAMALSGFKASYSALLGCCTANHLRIYRSMLAAAQGERNAD